MSSYTTEDKIRIIRRVVEDGESKSFVAKSEGCDRHTIDSWISRYNQNFKTYPCKRKLSCGTR